MVALVRKCRGGDNDGVCGDGQWSLAGGWPENGQKGEELTSGMRRSLEVNEAATIGEAGSN